MWYLLTYFLGHYNLLQVLASANLRSHTSRAVAAWRQFRILSVLRFSSTCFIGLKVINAATPNSVPTGNGRPPMSSNSWFARFQQSEAQNVKISLNGRVQSKTQKCNCICRLRYNIIIGANMFSRVIRGGTLIESDKPTKIRTIFG